jgi:PBSX family phage terminase large subunit
MRFVKTTDQGVPEFELHDKQKEALALLREHPDWTEYLLIGGSRCVSGDTVLLGHRKTVAELASRGKKIWVHSEGLMHYVDPPFVASRGILLTIKTAAGRTIRVSTDHMLYADGTWQKACDLSSGSHIAVRKPGSILGSIAQAAIGILHRFFAHETRAAFPVTENAIEIHKQHCPIQDITDTFCFEGTAEPEQYETRREKLESLLFRSYDEPRFGNKIYDVITSIEYGTKEEDLYTITVPGYARYCTQDGVIHHNSGKTFFGMHLLVVRALKYPNSRHMVCRLRFSHAKTSIWMDTLPKVLKAMGLVQKRDYKLNRTDFVVIFPNGSEIWVDGLDNAERVEKMLGREYNTLYYNEISQIPYDTVTTVQSRLALRAWSQKYGLCRNFSLFDANPPTKKHWSYVLWFLHKDPADLARPPLSEQRIAKLGYIKMNPQDNIKNVGENYIELLQNLPERKRKRFLEGEYSDVEGQIYDNWKVVSEIPYEVRQTAQVTLGVDFGFTTDPAVVLRLYFVRKRQGVSQLWIEQLVYDRGLTNQKLAKALHFAVLNRDKEITYNYYKACGGELSAQDFYAHEFCNFYDGRQTLMCYADGHEPKSIVELQESLNEYTDTILALSGLLGEDARRAGIDWLQDVEMLVCEDAVDVITELETYEYIKDDEGNPTTEPIKTGDHAMDALRYGVSPYIMKKTASLVAVGAS